MSYRLEFIASPPCDPPSALLRRRHTSTSVVMHPCKLLTAHVGSLRVQQVWGCGRVGRGAQFIAAGMCGAHSSNRA